MTEGPAMGGIPSNGESPSGIHMVPRPLRECIKPVAAKVAEAGLGESPMEVSQPVKEEATRPHEVSLDIAARFFGIECPSNYAPLHCLDTHCSSDH
jgi:hypothetical protein